MRNGHRIIATVQSSPQVTDLRSKVEKLGLQQAIVVEKLDLHDPYDMAHAHAFDVDVLWNNAGIGEAGPVAEIPLDLARRNYETNVFLPLALRQGFVRRCRRQRGRWGWGSSVEIANVDGRLVQTPEETSR